MSDHVRSSAQQNAVAAHLPDSQQHGSHQHGSHQHSSRESANEESESVLAGFHDRMVACSYENTTESAAEAKKIALMLLEKADLPLAYRARAHMILSRGDGDYLYHAREAVRIVEKGLAIFGPSNTPKEKATADELL